MRRHGRALAPPLREQLALLVEGLAAALASRELAGVARRSEQLAQLLDGPLAHTRKSALREYAEQALLAVAVAVALRLVLLEAFTIPSGSMLPTLQVGDHIFVNKFVYGLRVPFTTSPPRKLWRLGEPRRGEVVVFLYPSRPEEHFIKRVVGLPGDRVRLRGDLLWLQRRGEAEFRPVERHYTGQARYCDHDAPSDSWDLREAAEFEETLDGHTYRVIGASAPPASGWGQALANTRRLATPAAAVDTTADTFGPIPQGHVFVLGDNRDNSHDSRYFGTVPFDYVTGRASWTWFSRGGRVEQRCAVGVRWERTAPSFGAID